MRVVQDAERTLESELAIDDQSFIVADMIRETPGTDEVASVMSGVSIMVRQEDSLKTTANLMIEHQVHHLHVVSKDLRVLGIVSAIDFVRLAAENS